ncbi:MAG: GNAT family N-acetyltransferase [Proteobacteria bacterium]|nr:GNAT family N-acetyltransferase [Pseudomonadota bacterium]
MSLRLEVVSTPQRFAELQDSWDTLWHRSSGYVFQSHVWISAWISGISCQKDIRLLIGLAWDGDTLVGALPCAVHRRAGLRVLQWAAQRFSDYCDCLIDPDRPDAMETLWDGIGRAGGFDLIALQQIRPDAHCHGFLQNLAGSGGAIEPGDRQERCMRIENHWPSGHAFFRSLNKKGRNNHTRGKRILSELGGEVAFEVREPDTDVQALLETAVAWKLAWLRQVEPNSPLFTTDYPVFTTLLNAAWRQCPAKLFLLTCGGTMVAASLNFVYGGRMEAYFTAYDPAYERASPGTILIVEYSEWAFDRGLSHVDFLRGEEPFKFRLSNAETVIGSYSGARTLLGRIAVSGHRWLARHRHKNEVAAPQPAEAMAAAD